MLDVSSHVDVHIQVPQQVWLEVVSESGTYQSKVLIIVFFFLNSQIETRISNFAKYYKLGK